MRSFQTFFSISVIELKTDCSPLEIWCSINKCWLESKACFIQQASNLGRRALVQKPALKIVPDDEFLKGELFGDGIRTNNNTCLQNVFWLANGKVTVPCSRNLVLSLRLPSSTWAGTIAPIENAKVLSQRVGKTEQQNWANCFAYSLRRNQDTAPSPGVHVCVSHLILFNHKGSRNKSVLTLPSVMARPVEDKNEVPSSSQEPSESFQGQGCRGAQSWRKLSPANSNSKGPAPSPPGRVQVLGSHSISQRGGKRQSSGARSGKALKDMLRNLGFVWDAFSEGFWAQPWLRAKWRLGLCPS